MIEFNKTKKRVTFIVLVLLSFYSSLSFSEERSVVNENDAKHKGNEVNQWYFFTFENDVLSLVGDSDDGYTNGIGFAWGYEGYDSFKSIDMPDWIRFISDWTYINAADEKGYALGYGIAQGMYTPSDLSQENLIEGDRPYAGTLTWQVRMRSFADGVTNSIGLELGVLGPASSADKSQEVIHEMTDSSPPKGWDNQLENEAVFRIDGEYINRFAVINLSGNVQVDSNFYTDAGIGNLKSNAGTGFIFRIGNILEHSYSFVNPIPARSFNAGGVSKEKGFNWQVYASAYGQYVFNDITLDGNTFQDSYSVDLIHEQGLISLGTTLTYSNWGVLFSWQRGTREFEGQDKSPSYGSISLMYHH